jgi:RNA polymerase sigma-70 factor (ECF subfamily)
MPADAQLVAALRGGDEAAFAGLGRRLGPRAARAHVPSRAAAEEVVQETWLAVLRGIEHPGWWAAPPVPWDDSERRLEAAEARAAPACAIAALPPRQREALVLRDVLGLSSEEACGVLGVSEGNQRVLLHRARARVRAALEAELAHEGVAR